MPSSVAALIEHDHDRMVRLLRRVCAPGPSRARWRDELVVLLRAHAVAERNEVPGSTRRTRGDESLPWLPGDAERLERLAEEVAGLDVGSRAVEDRCSHVQQALDEHRQSFRTCVLDRLSATLGRKEMRQLGGRYLARRDAEAARLSSATTLPRALDRPRAELYEMARRLGIQGRSSMTRTQLINALRHQTHS